MRSRVRRRLQRRGYPPEDQDAAAQMMTEPAEHIAHYSAPVG